jgi:hypothetical protein
MLLFLRILIILVAAIVWNVAVWLIYVVTFLNFKGSTANLISYGVFAVVTGLIFWWSFMALNHAGSYVEGRGSR